MKALALFVFCITLIGCDQSAPPCNVSVVKSYTNGTNLFVELNNGQTLYAGESTVTHMYTNEAAKNTGYTNPTISTPELPNDSASYRNNSLVGIWKLYSKGNGTNDYVQTDNYYLTINSDGSFEKNDPERIKGHWFSNSGWFLGRKLNLLNLMKVNNNGGYSKLNGNFFGNDPFDPFVFYFTEVNGSKQLVLLNLWGNQEVEKLTYIKQ
jgi:hypothetical protein